MRKEVIFAIVVYAAIIIAFFFSWQAAVAIPWYGNQ